MGTSVSPWRKVFKNMDGVKMNGTKSMIGHGLGAAGGLEAVTCIMARPYTRPLFSLT
jgi:3-oxoacyl-[acyl-carrier-protein] synthase II